MYFLLSMVSLTKNHPVLKIINIRLWDLPSPSTLYIMWNFGSLLGLCLSIQIVTGLFLAFHFSADTQISFLSVRHLYRDVNYGWILRLLHANGARAFFICLYLHVARGIFFSSYRWQETWIIGVVLLFLVMATAFLGYVLPWGQISFWGATVITNLFSAIPYIGTDIVLWLWGGFAVDNPTLTRFFALHFLIPFTVAAASSIHLLFLHQHGSSNPLGISINSDKSPFHPYFTIKDTLGGVMFFTLFIILNFQIPWILGDCENFIPANPLVTPVHIQPEWYFLFAYAILRSIPNKLGGVVALAAAVIVLIILPFFTKPKFQRLSFYPLSNFFLWAFFRVFLLLTWIGARPVEEPYVLVGQVLTVIYFRFFCLYAFTLKSWDSLLDYS